MRPGFPCSLAVIALVLGGTTEVLACPVCETPTGIEVRQGIFNERFWVNVAAVLSPFPIFAGAVAWILFGGRKLSSKSNETNH
jgi:hypothetical protein